MRTPPRHLTFANVASATALVVALAGSGVAVASGLARDSVRSPQIADGQVKTADLAANAVTGAKVAPDSLTGADVKESTLTLPPGARIDAGDTPLNNTSLTASVEDYATVTAKAPTAGYLLVTADASFSPGQAGTGIYATVYDGNQLVGGALWSPGGYPVAPGVYNQQSQTFAVPVTKGTHALVLRLSEYSNGSPLDTTSNVYLPHLTAVFLPSGTAGNPPIPD